MLLKCYKELFLEHLEVVEKALSAKTTMPVLNNIFLEKVENRLTFMTTNLEIGIRSEMQIEKKENDESETGGIENGKVLVPSKIIDIIRHFPSGEEVEVIIDNDSYNIEITCGEANFKLKGINADEFPVFREPEPENKPLIIKEKELREMVRKTIFAASADESRPAFTGVLFLFEDNQLNMIASDTYRLVTQKKEIDSWEYKENKFLVPARALRELLKLLHNDEGEVLIFPVDNQLFFSFGHVFFVSRLLEDKFPDFRRVIPDKMSTKILVERSMFEDIIGRAALLTDNESKAAGITLKDDKILISAKSEQGKMKDEMHLISASGEDVNILLNVRFIQDVLKVAESDIMEIEFSGREGPCIIRPEKEVNFLYLVLPIKVEQPL